MKIFGFLAWPETRYSLFYGHLSRLFGYRVSRHLHQYLRFKPGHIVPPNVIELEKPSSDKLAKLFGVSKKFLNEYEFSLRFALAFQPFERGMILAGKGITLIKLLKKKSEGNTFLRLALQEWRKVNKPYAKLFSAELYRLLGEFDKAKKLLEQAKKHYRKGKAAYYCKVIEELIKMRTTKFYDVPDIIGETQHKVGDNEWLLISPSGVKLKKIVPKFWRFGKKEVVEKISKEEAMEYFDKLDELGKAKLLALDD